MMVNEQWIPLDHTHEKPLVDKLVREQRTFIKPLRYEAKYASHFPNVLLLDVGAQPVALDILSAFLMPQERIAKASGMAERRAGGWVWDTAQHAVVPEVPPKVVHRLEREAPAAATFHVPAAAT
jgi:hypothetical protein